MLTRKMNTKRAWALSLSLLFVLAVTGLTFLTEPAEAVGTRGDDGCFWTAHTEIDFFDNPQMTGPPVGWRVKTCNCNVYTGGSVTPWFTVISETPCP